MTDSVPLPRRAEPQLPGSKKAATATTRQEQHYGYRESRVTQLRVVGAAQQVSLRELRERGQPKEAKHKSSCITGELPTTLALQIRDGHWRRVTCEMKGSGQHEHQ